MCVSPVYFADCYHSTCPHCGVNTQKVSTPDKSNYRIRCKCGKDYDVALESTNVWDGSNKGHTQKASGITCPKCGFTDVRKINHPNGKYWCIDCNSYFNEIK
jgi:DNA-directed RNA polymerase subunit RPC12/RpoP